jgi:hypothetical protein
VSWKYDAGAGFFTHVLNGFSDASYYFLTTDLGAGKKIASLAQASGTVTNTVTRFNDYACYERNLYNLIRSGRQWFSDKISSSPYDTTFTFANIITDEAAKIKINVASRSSSRRKFNITIQYRSDTITVDGVNLSLFTGAYASQSNRIFSWVPSSDDIYIKVAYNRYEYSDLGWLDYITVNARRNLIMTGDLMFFRDIASTGSGNISRFSVSDASEGLKVWDVTDPYNVVQQDASLTGSELSFIASTDNLHEFVAFKPDAVFPKPKTEGSDLGWIANQNLHADASAQMLIVTYPAFLEQAETLAQYHREKDNLSVLVATTDQVFNEFSSGKFDVSAIRDFARMLYLKGQGSNQLLQYLLLFGDGSYNNHTKVDGNSNFIPTYQSTLSLSVSASYVSDDFYGLMDDDEGGSENMEAYMLDLSVGRLPVSKVSEAESVVAKIMGYNCSANMNDWRNKIMFVADDGDSDTHMVQADEMADSVSKYHPQFVIKKILSDAYKQVASSTGARYPDVTKAIYDNMHKGVLIFNYTGHGNEKGLAEEQLVTREQLMEYKNADKLPLFITATCEFSRYDDLSDDETGNIKEITSAGEASLLNPSGGCIGLLSTSRVVFSSDNAILNNNFYTYAFQFNGDGLPPRLGDIIRFTKNDPNLYDNRNKLNFTLLGDPALRLAVPKFTVVTDSLNGASVTDPLDTLKAFKEITIKGHLVDMNSNKLAGFNGILYPSVYDKEVTVSTLGNDNKDDIMTFTVRDNILYRGKANVTNGDFAFSFIVPKDIIYSLGKGKVYYYAQDSTDDANGYFSECIIGGTNSELSADETGPDLYLYMNDANFVNGGITDRNPKLFARIHDENGINTTGIGIGHDIVGILDGDATQPLVLNDFYEADLDDFRDGSLRYPLSGLSLGMHTIKMRVWDIFNNPAEAGIDFEVIDQDDLILQNVYNYPNPAQTYTCFQFEHNKAGQTMKITIDIYNLSGGKIRTFEESAYMEGYHSSPIIWDLSDQNGNPLRSGIYPYRVRVEDETGLLSDGFYKLLILR